MVLVKRERGGRGGGERKRRKEERRGEKRRRMKGNANLIRDWFENVYFHRSVDSALPSPCSGTNSKSTRKSAMASSACIKVSACGP